MDDFASKVGKGKIKLLILDRVFLDGEMIATFKGSYGIDVLIPLKKNIAAHLGAKRLSRLEAKTWKRVDKRTTCYMAKKITSYDG